MNFIGNKLTGFFMKRTMILNDLPRICFIFNKALQGNFQKQREYIQRQSLFKNCLYLLFFWSLFSCIQTEFEDLQSKPPYLVQMRENTDQKNFKYGHFSCNE